MSQYSQSLQHAEEALKRSQLGAMPHVLQAWKSISWKENAADAGVVAAQMLASGEGIALFPALLRLNARAQSSALIKEFGLFLYKKCPASGKTVWEKKLCLPEGAQMQAFQGKLQSPDFATYRELTESFCTAMDRLVAINLSNALLCNHVPRDQSRNLNIFTWGATADYANLRRNHSILPLVSAYGNRDVLNCPGSALADLIVNELKSLRETSVAEAFRQFLTNFFAHCH